MTRQFLSGCKFRAVIAVIVMEAVTGYPPGSSWVILTAQTTRLPAAASCKLCGSVKKTVKVFFAGRDSFKQENCIAQHQFKSFQELGIESEGMYLSLSATKE